MYEWGCFPRNGNQQEEASTLEGKADAQDFSRGGHTNATLRHRKRRHDVYRTFALQHRACVSQGRTGGISVLVDASSKGFMDTVMNWSLEARRQVSRLRPLQSPRLEGEIDIMVLC